MQESLVPRALCCQLCYYKITSDEHYKRCINISMYDIYTSLITPEIKSMMTYGLDGCTAILMIFFTKDTNISYYVIFGHHPNERNIIEWFNTYYIKDYNIVTIIKTAGYYCYKNGILTIKPYNENYWISNIIKNNCKLILESYSLNDILKFKTSLYFKIILEQPYYSDNYGRYINIIF